MLDQSLIKTNFLGRDGFIWWIGQIPPEGNHREQINGGGWSHRYKVRILGYDSPDSATLKDDDLRWAQTMLPTTAGSGAANQAMSVMISPGDTVFGFFLDGNDLNVPVITGVFPRTSQVSTDSYTRPFQPYSGYTSKVDNDGAYIFTDQSNENNTASQKSPRIVTPQQAKKMGPDERSAFSGIGDVIKAASGSSATTVQKMSTEIDNFVNRIQTITDKVSGAIGGVKDLIEAEVLKVTEKIQKISSGLINDLMNNMYRSLASTLNMGLKILYQTTYSLVFAATGSDRAAHIAGVVAQQAFVPGVKAIQDKLPCLANTVLSAIGETVNGLLQSVAENVANFAGCVANQFIGGLLNHIIDISDKILSPLVYAVDAIRLGFEVVDFLRSSAESLLSPRNNISCTEVKPSYVSAPANKWVIGRGPNNQPGIPISSIVDSANNAAALAGIPLTTALNSEYNTVQRAADLARSVTGAIDDVKSGVKGLSSITGSLDLLKKDFSAKGFKGAVSNCAGLPSTNCKVNVKIFGGRGKGAVAKAIIGHVVGEGLSATGSIIGFDIISGGSNYDFPPFVEIVDDCKQGRGAVARAVVKGGEVVDIYVVSEGENYADNVVDEAETDDPQVQTDYQNSTGPYVINEIAVVDPGTGYTNEDTVIDVNNPEVEYKVQVEPVTGAIVKILPINSERNNVVEIKDLPELKVRTRRGYGVLLKARLKPRRTYQGEVKQQIDCIT